MKLKLILLITFLGLNTFSQSERKDFLSRQTDITDQQTKESSTIKERVYIVYNEPQKYFNFNFIDRKQTFIISVYFTSYNEKIKAYKIAPNEWGIENVIYNGHSISFEINKPNQTLVMFLNLEKQ